MDAQVLSALQSCAASWPKSVEAQQLLGLASEARLLLPSSLAAYSKAASLACSATTRTTTMTNYARALLKVCSNFMFNPESV